MAEWLKLGTTSDVPSGSGKCFEVGDRMIAVFNVEGAFHAIDNTCLHRGGPLAEGTLEGTTVTCPWHAWEYDVRTGLNIHSEDFRVKCYPLETRGEELYVEVGD